MDCDKYSYSHIMENREISTFVQELILEKVRVDMIARAKISQSSAQRQKRGHTALNQRPDSTDTKVPLSVNNNDPYSQVEKNSVLHAKGTTGEPEQKLQELTCTNTDDNNEEEECVSTDSLSEISKFESETFLTVVMTVTFLIFIQFIYFNSFI